MLCKNRITLIGFLGQNAETRTTPNGNSYTRFSLATSISWKQNGNSDYKTRTEWHRVICWNKLADWAGNLHKGGYVEVEGELRYREYTPTESDRNVRVANLRGFDSGVGLISVTGRLGFRGIRSGRRTSRLTPTGGHRIGARV